MKRRITIFIFNIINTILLIILIALVSLVFIEIIAIGVEKADYNTCQKLKGQSEQYRLFYLTINEKRMCDRLGVNINAPIEYNKEFYKLIK
ncbi:MAG: hypothetical protein KAT66_00355 [Candidatus Lokiarchaeota archaeon]|nr:hypothetical protein [Candidatus Lokiarchaeota archaeon]